MRDILTVMWKEWRELVWHGGSAARRPAQPGGPARRVRRAAAVPVGRRLGDLAGDDVLLGLGAADARRGRVADSFAGERERHTLETLLASRLPDRAILFGKVLAAVGYGWVLVMLMLVLSLVTVNLTVATPGSCVSRRLPSARRCWRCSAQGSPPSAGVLVSLRRADGAAGGADAQRRDPAADPRAGPGRCRRCRTPPGRSVGRVGGERRRRRASSWSSPPCCSSSSTRRCSPPPCGGFSRASPEQLGEWGLETAAAPGRGGSAPTTLRAMGRAAGRSAAVEIDDRDDAEARAVADREARVADDHARPAVGKRPDLVARKAQPVRARPGRTGRRARPPRPGPCAPFRDARVGRRRRARSASSPRRSGNGPASTAMTIRRSGSAGTGIAATSLTGQPCAAAMRPHLALRQPRAAQSSRAM